MLKTRILIVDDEKQNVDALTRSLSDQNPSWDIVSASNEDEAIKIIEMALMDASPIDMLLTDLVMKTKESGITLLRDARKLDPTIMGILFTANEKNLDRFAAFDVGAFEVIDKNILGASSAREINVKTRAALKYRDWFRQVTFAQRYFDPRVFETISKNPEVLELQSRKVTVAFWDVRGFSLLCEILKAHPELIADFLKEYCESAAQLIFSNGGILDKFIGDGVMALFGVLGEGMNEKESSLAALKTAVALRKQFDVLTAKWVEIWNQYTPQQITVGLGCGIHCGDALVGNVGTAFRDQFTALGSTVNFTSRIEGKAAAGQILVSQSIHAHLKDELSFVESQKLNDIKNIPGVFTLYELGATQLLLP